MRIFLLQPPVQDFYETDIRLQPLGLAYLKAIILEKFPDVEVCLRDFHAGHGRKTIALPPEFNHLKNYYRGKERGAFSTFSAYFHFGASFEQIACEVLSWRPDVVGISSLFSPYYREVLLCARAIKQKMNIPIIVGGGHASVCPELMLNSNAVDFVIRGEGERPIVQWIGEWKKERDWRRVSNLAYKEDGRIILNDMEENYSLEELPSPDFSDLDGSLYSFEKRPLSFIMTSRSCPFNCAFCSVHSVFGRDFRQRSIDGVINEMKKRFQEGVRVFDFEDDNLTFDRQWFLNFCARIKSVFEGEQIELMAMNGISYFCLDPEVLLAMKESGFRKLNISLVSLSEKVCHEMSRPLDRLRFEKVVETANLLGLEVTAYQIIGLPGEPLESMIQTLGLLARLPVLIGISVFYLPPGSDLQKRMKIMSEEEIFSARLSVMSEISIEIDRECLFTFFILARMLNYFKSGKKEFWAEEALSRIKVEKKYYRHLNGHWTEEPRFRYDLMQKVFDEADIII